MDFKCNLIEIFHWSLYDFDRTDIESLIPFAFYYPQWKAKVKTTPAQREKYADEVDWL